MSKAVKKKSRRTWRTIRKTLGTLFLVSALVVAAIPVDYLQAEGEGTVDEGVRPRLKVEEADSKIPQVSEGATIYTTGDGMFQFAYVTDPTGGGDRGAVILGYAGGALTNNALVIPDTLEAYRKYKTTVGSSQGYVAVTAGDEFLFYPEYRNEIQIEEVNKKDENGNLVIGEDGEPVKDKIEKEVPVFDRYSPCYYRDYSKWGQFEEEELFYLPKNKENQIIDLTKKDTCAQVGSGHYRIMDAQVWYIGNQYLKVVDEDDTTTEDASNSVLSWEIGGSVDNDSADEKGVFALKSNIVSLSVGQYLRGIGNSAFYGCTGLSSITLNNGITTIGNYAFAGCNNMTQANIALHCNLDMIGAYAFNNCESLTSFTVPVPVTKIGDGAFEGCTSMKEITMSGTDEEESPVFSLRELGNNVFRNCTALQSLTFPRSFNNNGTNVVSVSMFSGCPKLEHITAYNANLTFTSADNFAAFKAMVPDTFYFEGYGPKSAYGDSKLHGTATDNHFVFKYLNEDLYEITQDGNDVYRVDSKNELKETVIPAGIEKIEMPDQIGPYHIGSIGSDAFRDKCTFKEITIPASVTYIAANAFKGCHNLKNVIFTNSEGLKIEDGAFKTQVIEASHKGCNGSLAQEPELNFVGSISTESVSYGSFEYAMKENNNYNATSQPETYIKYYSGWPTNLVVQYDRKTKNTLIEYPTFTKLYRGNYLVGYCYMTDEQRDATVSAAEKYLENQNAQLSDSEAKAINNTLNIELPAGIQAIKEGLFAESEKEEIGTIGEKGIRKTLTTKGLIEVPTRAFEDAIYLGAVDLAGNLESVGDYAFKGCVNLLGASVSANVNKLGTAPFIGCDKLMNVGFNGSPKFNCDNSIIYELNEDRTKKALVEYLNGRGSGTVEKSETAGISGIYPEAFRDTDVYAVDFSDSQFEKISEGVFQDTEDGIGLQNVVLPLSCTVVGDDAFTNSKIRSLTVPNMTCILRDEIFEDTDGDGYTDLKSMTVYSPNGSLSQAYARTYSNWKEIEGYYTVRFLGYDEESGKDDDYVIKTIDYVKPGWPVIALEPKTEEIPLPPNRTFDKWDYKEENPLVNSNMDVKAIYSNGYKVVFYDTDRQTIIADMDIMPGKPLLPPAFNKEGILIAEWLNEATREILTYNDFQDINVTEDMEFTAYDAAKTAGYKVSFYDSDRQTLLKAQNMLPGASLTPPAFDKQGKLITEWINEATREVLTYGDFENLIVTEAMEFTAHSKNDSNGGSTNNPGPNDPGTNDPGTNDPGTDNPSGPKEGQHTLQVLNGSGSGYYAKDEQIIITANGPADGMEFSEWDVSPADTVVTDKTRSVTILTMPDKDVAVVAVYKPKGANSQNSNYHSLLVHNGSGSGSYVAGAQIIITANEPGRGQTFSGWTVSPADTVVTDKTIASAIITMPDHDVAVIANYTGGTTPTTVSSTGSGNTPSGTGTNTRPNTTSGSTGGTTVVIDKNGLSNTGVVSATVHGSSDNFTIKVTESSAAAEAALKALQAEYGSLDNIKYFPMDISLYDSTGTTKITDTTGLSVSITLPLPDSLIPYAGNNKVAGVVNDRLDKLTPRFSTINGVACITFTAEHFSPYLIYVDVTNLSDGTISDSTPKTGDGIHPKWFLSIGLACLSFVMFMVKDNKGSSKKKQKVTVKARN